MSVRLSAATVLLCLAMLSLGACLRHPLTENRGDNAAGDNAADNAAGDAEAAPAGDRSLAVKQTWTGQYHLPSTPDGGYPEPPAMVCRDMASFRAFVDGIPKRVVQPTQTRPASNDPLLKDPTIDFASKMVIVIFSASNMYTKARIRSVRIAGGNLEVDAFYPDPSEDNMQQNQLGVGTYTAVLVERVDGVILEVNAEREGR